MTKYVGTAFSMQMSEGGVGLIEYVEISEQTFRKLMAGAVSYVGHKDMAEFLGVPVNRENLTLKDGDVLYLAQKCAGRNGSNKPPEEVTIKYYQMFCIGDKL
jgi:hypothetical protein